MSLEDSAKRLANSRILPDYFWFEGAAVTGLIENLKAAGAKARLEVHLGLKESGELDAWLRVKHPEGQVVIESHLPDGNDSHVCPPNC